MVRLGNIDLDENLRLKGLETAPVIAASSVTSFDGSVITMVMPAAASRSLTLLALRNGSSIEGYFTHTQVMAMRSIAEAGLPTTIIHDRGTFTVLVLSVEELVPVIDYRDPPADAKYVGPVYLMEV